MEEKQNRWQSPQMFVVLASIYVTEWSFGFTPWPPRRHDITLFAAYGLGSMAGDGYRAHRRRAAVRAQAEGEEALLLTDVVGRGERSHVH